MKIGAMPLSLRGLPKKSKPGTGVADTDKELFAETGNEIMSQAAMTELSSAVGDEFNAFTFWVDNSLFAINLENVLSIEQDSSHIQPDPFQGRGALGIVKHRGVPVRVFDFAEFLGVGSCGTQKEDLITSLLAREQDHVEWLDALERALLNGEVFSKARDPHQCAFGKWYDSFETRDDELREIMEQFDAPHKRIHALADQLLGLKDSGRTEEALDVLKAERLTTLAELRRLFDRARDQVRDSIRSVLLFVTTNGKEPRVALRLNQISDMVTFGKDSLTPTNSLGVAEAERLSGVISGYLSSRADKDCLLVDVDGLLNAVTAGA